MMKSKPWQPPAQAPAPERVLHWSPEVGYRLGNSAEPGTSQLAAALLLAARAVQVGLPFSLWSLDDKSPLISWDGNREATPVYHKPELRQAFIEVTSVYANMQLLLLERVRYDIMAELAQSTEAAAAAPDGASTGSETPPDSASDAPIDKVPATSEQLESEQSSADTAATTSVTG